MNEEMETKLSRNERIENFLRELSIHKDNIVPSKTLTELAGKHNLDNNVTPVLKKAGYIKTIKPGVHEVTVGKVTVKSVEKYKRYYHTEVYQKYSKKKKEEETSERNSSFDTEKVLKEHPKSSSVEDTERRLLSLMNYKHSTVLERFGKLNKLVTCSLIIGNIALIGMMILYIYLLT